MTGKRTRTARVETKEGLEEQGRNKERGSLHSPLLSTTKKLCVEKQQKQKGNNIELIKRLKHIIKNKT
jgi:hypothetical protein